ncbi:MAG: aminotransferase class III-fold pyridoxal phosphate-dependent enzyme [Actinomycetia bacterium]|nr:aminotransferase class III-fold pyridoxal phosphate-dependent enzyme [Actinomycetes bacterium]
MQVATEPARTSLLGGISSAFRINPFTGTHLEVARADGCTIQDTAGNEYIDMFMSHGTTVLGHHHPKVFEGVRQALEQGVVIGYETGLGEEVAVQLVEHVPSAEAVRFVASGSEAVMTAMRLARAHTHRDIIVKIDGHFHGGSDYAMLNSLVANTDADNAGGHRSRAIMSSGGIPRAVADTVIPVPWNDLPALQEVLTENQGRIAGVMMVPIDFNNGCLVPTAGYLEAVGALAHEAGALFIFDEILSGFKTGLGGAQDLYGVTPDVTTLSKALSSGFPLSAVVGTLEVMQTLLKPPPEGAIQGGTFAGNIPGLGAAKATLAELSQPDFYPTLLGRSERFFTNLQAMFDASPLPARVQSAGCMFTVYVGTREPVTSYADIRALDPALGRKFFRNCIDAGLYYQTDFSVSIAHSDQVLDEVVDRMAGAARKTA